jgi:hypothetical protein
MFSDRSLAWVADYDMLLNSYPLVSLQTPSLSVKQLWGETIAYIAYVPNSQCWWLLIDWYWLPTCVLQCGSLLSQGLTVLPGHWFGFSCDALVRFLTLDFRCVVQCSLPLLWNILGTYNATCYPFKDKALSWGSVTHSTIPRFGRAVGRLVALAETGGRWTMETLMMVSLRWRKSWALQQVIHSHSFCWCEEFLHSGRIHTM